MVSKLTKKELINVHFLEIKIYQREKLKWDETAAD